MQKKICLNMIVKDESKAIVKCLESLKGIVDYWVIVDTGSTDGTQQIVKETLADLPGELHEEPWVSFEHNRNQALSLARGKADYILIMDADDTLQFLEPLDKTNLEKDFYCVKSRDPQVDSFRMILVNNNPSWFWRGLLHEELLSTEKLAGELLPHIVKDGMGREGKRNEDPERYAKDAEMMEKLLEEDPTNTRTVFYLAQSYLTAKNYPMALKYYEQRADMGGSLDEVFWSLYYIGCLQDDLDMDEKLVICSYWRAYEFDARRAEPLCALSRHLLKKNNIILGYLVARIGLALPVPQTVLYVRRAVYEYQMLLYFSLSAHILGRHDEACSGYVRLLENVNLPENIRSEVKRNLSVASRREPFAGATVD